MFDFRQIVQTNAARQHVIGTIQQDDLPVVAAGGIPKIVGGWRTEGHQVSLLAECERVQAACLWLTERNTKFRLGVRWMIEQYGSDVDCTLDDYAISIESSDCDLIALFHIIFV